MVEGHLRKMQTELATPVLYQLLLNDNKISLNENLGKKISLKFTGLINCIHCSRKTKKSFQQGYCFPCYQRLGECNLCMIHPERCLHGEGNCQPDDWVHANCMAPHIVYLANSSGIKVGVTRQTQVPTRWIDQGALQALPIYSTSNRYQAGCIEVAIKQFISDKTNWRAMLKGQNERIDLVKEREAVQKVAADAILEVLKNFPSSEIQCLNDNEIIQISYPVLEFPEKVISQNFDKEPLVEGTLLGIKGQYLILDTGVLNIRKFGGYAVEVTF